ncbi:uncharacterized protein PSFLO_00907 [Pseudozyma flocculosa]|uniref:SUZ domain-containing protein n=1 Tax=Pseudozyma flocculosa TaxID=84751 RepID=A0A5C3EV53_9BASI|nr:uncharacterized protein PSFLO_00907 [Pseudozyma flocculosa]
MSSAGDSTAASLAVQIEQDQSTAVDQLTHALQAATTADPAAKDTSATHTQSNGSPAPALAASTLSLPESAPSLAASRSNTPAPAVVPSIPSASPSESLASLASSLVPTAPAAPIDDTILGALKNSRDRVFYMQHEREMALFVRDPARQRLDLPLMNTYQRLLVHRCADQFNLDHQLDPTTRAVSLTKTPETCMPELRISQRVAALFGDRESGSGKASPAQASTPPHNPMAGTAASAASSSFASAAAAAGGDLASGTSSAVTSPVSAGATPPPPSGFRIMRRNPTASSRGSQTPAASTSGSNSDSERSELAGCGKAVRKDRKNMTIEEREAAYKAARERIFGKAEASDAPKADDKKGGASATASSTSGSNASVSGKPSKQSGSSSGGGGGGGGGGRKKAGGSTSLSGSQNGSTESFSRGRNSANRKADATLPADDDLLGYSRNMVPPSTSTGLWRPQGQVQSQPKQAGKDSPLGFPVLGVGDDGGPAVAQDASLLPMPHYAAGPAGSAAAMAAQYGYPPAMSMQPQARQACGGYPGDLQAGFGGAPRTAGASSSAQANNLRAKAPVFLPPGSQGITGQWSYTPETGGSRGPSTPGSEGSYGAGPRQQQQMLIGGHQFLGADRDAFSPFPPSNPSSAGTSMQAVKRQQTASPVSAWKLAPETNGAGPNAWDATGQLQQGQVMAMNGGSQPAVPQQPWMMGPNGAAWAHQQQPFASSGGQRGPARGGPSYNGQGGPGWGCGFHAQGHGRYPRASSSSSLSATGSLNGSQTAPPSGSRDDSMSATSTSSSRSSQVVGPSSSTKISHPSLPSKPSWIQKNGSGSEAGTPSIRSQGVASSGHASGSSQTPAAAAATTATAAVVDTASTSAA